MSVLHEVVTLTGADVHLIAQAGDRMARGAPARPHVLVELKNRGLGVGKIGPGVLFLTPEHASALAGAFARAASWLAAQEVDA